MDAPRPKSIDALAVSVSRPPCLPSLDGAGALRVQRPGARTKKRQSKEASGHRGVFLKLDRLISAHMENGALSKQKPKSEWRPSAF